MVSLCNRRLAKDAAPTGAVTATAPAPGTYVPVQASASGLQPAVADARTGWTYTVPAGAFTAATPITLSATMADGSPLPPGMAFKGSTFTADAHALSGVEVHWGYADHGIDIEHGDYVLWSDADILRLRAAGFHSVRMFFDADLSWNNADPSDLSHQWNVQVLEANAARFEAYGLGVILCPFGTHWQSVGLEGDPAKQQLYVDYAGAFSREMSRLDPDKTFLETVNEPQFTSPANWRALERRMILAMRAGAPKDTILAAVNLRSAEGRWDVNQALAETKPYTDSNVAYAIHWYAPMAFTHAGAGWVPGPVDYTAIHDMPYPVLPDTSVDETGMDAGTKAAVGQYLRDGWNKSLVDAKIATVAEWAKTHHVRLVADELGVDKHGTLPAARLSWLRDVSSALQRNGIGWSVWSGDPADAFGVTSRNPDGSIQVDPDVTEALGLNAEPHGLPPGTDMELRVTATDSNHGTAHQDLHFQVASDPGLVPFGPDTLSIRAAGQSWDGDPKFLVMLDGAPVTGAIEVAAPFVGDQATRWQDIQFNVTLDHGKPTHGLAILFLNDAWGGTGKDRNLFIQGAQIDGKELAPSSGFFSGGASLAPQLGGEGLYRAGALFWHF
jgi:endoglucanase